VSARLARWATGLAVLAVAVIAGIVSYSHVESLALSHGYSLATARLLPFSVDGLIVASSLALANGARAWLARTGLVLGIVATVAANVAYGQSFGVTGEVISAWPSLAFLLASEILLSMRARPVADEAGIEAGGQNSTSAHQARTDEAGQADEDQADDAPARVLPMPTGDALKPTRTRARTGPKRKPAPEKLFAADIQAGDVPSIRAIKTRAHVGTDRARAIREELAVILRDAAEAA
jgi:hypothetical protein